MARSGFLVFVAAVLALAVTFQEGKWKFKWTQIETKEKKNQSKCPQNGVQRSQNDFVWSSIVMRCLREIKKRNKVTINCCKIINDYFNWRRMISSKNKHVEKKNIVWKKIVIL